MAQIGWSARMTEVSEACNMSRRALVLVLGRQEPRVSITASTDGMVSVGGLDCRQARDVNKLASWGETQAG
jgi:hypothetical protein